jgi:hypothetical protein
MGLLVELTALELVANCPALLSPQPYTRRITGHRLEQMADEIRRTPSAAYNVFRVWSEKLYSNNLSRRLNLCLPHNASSTISNLAL